jgi:SAM-dependent methyltransferase
VSAARATGCRDTALLNLNFHFAEGEPTLIDYARISKMVEYQKANVWPLNVMQNTENTPWLVFRRGTRGWEHPWVLEQLGGLPRGAKVLDCGCGRSGFVEELHRRGFQPTGLDLLVGEKEETKGYGITNDYVRKLRGKVSFITADLHNIPGHDGYFDAVTCISVMEHIVIAHKEDAAYHLKCLDEMKRVLRPGGLLICTYDTILNEKVVYGERPEWGEGGWNHLKDIEYLGMPLKQPDSPRYSTEDIMADEDAFFVPPDLYLRDGYGNGFDHFGPYHRLTSVGFVLMKQ